jgi:hypothetical protein
MYRFKIIYKTAKKAINATGQTTKSADIMDKLNEVCLKSK